MILRFNKTFETFLFLLLFLCQFKVAAQPCTIKLTGQIIDESINAPLTNASISMHGKPITYSDSLGNFSINNLCAGNIHLQIFHIGCDSKKVFIELKNDTFIILKLDHHYHSVTNLILKGEEHHSNETKPIPLNEILAQSNKSLAEAVASLPGVAVSKTGNSVAKPIIDGFFGNRVQIVNNGVLLSSQQWGNDHAPEIDLAAAGELTVIKGTEMLSYPGNAMGGIVYIKRKNIGTDPHIHGIANVLYDNNGRGNTSNLLLSKGGKKLGLKLVGTYKNFGDFKTPLYFLNNTGRKEYNFALQLEKKWSEKWFSNLSYNFYNAEFGILKGSQIGNLTDLQASIQADTPFYTLHQFNRGIEAPKQKVQHHFVTLQTHYFRNNKNTYYFTYNLQKNNRKEFDLRRGGRTDIPALSLEKWSNYLEFKRNIQTNSKTNVDIGLQQTYDINSNDVATGILPLIPNYNQYNVGGFTCIKMEQNKQTFSFAARLDFANLQASPISKTTPKKYLNAQHQFLTKSGALGYKKYWKNEWSFKSTLLYIERAPDVSELYSNGLHQGVSGIEEGNSALKPEKSLKIMVHLQKVIHHHLTVNTEMFYQPIWDYIYLQPLQDFRLTIRGAFPVFQYTKTNATLLGANAVIIWEDDKHLENQFKFSYINGRNHLEKNKLIYLPPVQLSNQFIYHLQVGKKQNEISANTLFSYTFRQTGLNASQDLKAAPPAYFITNIGVHYKWRPRQNEVLLSLSANNLFNIRYRDYLNRQRYFTDEMGRNIQARIMMKF